MPILAGVHITTVDISDSSHPVRIWVQTQNIHQFQTSWPEMDMYMEVQVDTFSIYDVTDPSHPSIVSTTKVYRNSRDIRY